MSVESSALLTMPIFTSSGTLRLFPSSRPVQFFPVKASAASSFAGSFHHRVSDSTSISSSTWLSSLKMSSPRLLASISSSSSLYTSGGGGGVGLTGGSGGGGSDGGSSGRVAGTGPFVGETEEEALGSELIFLNVGGMTCGGCAASVKRILENQPQVASATVYFEKAIAVVWAVPEAKDTENWQQQLGQKLASHLTTCGFKSEFHGQGNAIEKGI
ncbi:copper-transporting ATPase PAA1, chloroplastic-like [Phalaenopsis equestris]|uniref:copper-transporting ATPase PAA1, chloroplastic-like n=1 Tax=Phalaenopsis equestris TaxID=78828 RepID=UPI0009E4D859|nr:copper-transporting ATPase PAA1, chloroplastic-like [Phalaenopsis equestris]XP_020588707.1 copper-transporting ATPase PAA1, chloroplastic-like [Phalaenopsis equestris]XP_020588715.1 copper-transporting ATPase PAA1, chloroplastic-like [Phalaenopsis equestris]